MTSASLKPQILLWLLLAAVLALLIPSYGALHALWTDTDSHTYTHGYLILGICIWLVWRALPRVLAAPLIPAPRLLLPLAFASAAWAVALTAGVQDIDLLLLPVIVWLSVAVTFGQQAARELLLPIGFIVFALPFWSSGNFILQQITVWVNGSLIWLTGMAAYVQGNIVLVPAGRFEIADGCSGLHFFIVGLAIAALYGELGRDTLRRRLEWLVLAGLLSMLSNWLRVFIIIVAGYLTDMQHYLVRVEHYRFGWFVFAGTLLLFFWIANRRSLSAALATSPVAQPTVPSLLSRNVTAAGLALLLAGLFSLLAWRAAAPADAGAEAALKLDWPEPVADGSSAIPSTWAPVYPGASATGMRSYVLPSGAQLEAYQAVYLQQRQGAEMVGGEVSLFGNEQYDVVAERVVDAGNNPWRQWQIETPVSNLLIRARWQVGRHTFVRPAESQLWYGALRLIAPVTSTVVALRIRCAESCAAAQTALDEAGKLLPFEPVSATADTGIGR